MTSITDNKNSTFINAAVIVAALGYFVDIYDLLLFSIVRIKSLKSLGLTGTEITSQGEFIISMQMWGMLLGGIFWGILGDKKGRLSVLFGSILIYSLANIANGFVDSVSGYALCRFIAGIGLAGELGAGITLVTETLSKEKRGLGTMIVASIGVSGAIMANLVSKAVPDWRICYFIGGGLGLLLLFLRVSVVESGMFKQIKENEVSKGNFLALFTDLGRLKKYFRCVLIGIPLWFVVGILISFSPEFGKALGIIGNIEPGTAVAYCYGGLVVGDIGSGLLSQWLKSRKKVMVIFLLLNALMVIIYLNAYNISVNELYYLSFGMGVSVGFWVIFVTIAAEQFGTNIRSTVTTTVPNFVRGSLPILIILFKFIRHQFESVRGIQSDNIIWAGMILAFFTIIVAFLALWKMKETFHEDLDYTESL